MSTEPTPRKGLLLLLGAVTIAFAFIIWPYFGAVFWAVVLAVLFSPVQRRILGSMPTRRTSAALATLLLCVVVVVIPLAFVATALVREGASLYADLLSRKLDVRQLVDSVVNGLPTWAGSLLDKMGVGNTADIQDKLTDGALQASRVLATRALTIGQGTLELLLSAGIMLYLLFFLLRDGAALLTRIRHALPLTGPQKQRLFSQTTSVIRATVKGNVVVAAVQGTLGGLMFWFLGVEAALLWGALMALLSLLPVVGAALVWGPVALYFLFAGPLWKGVVLVIFAVFVIGLIDNLLRPLLVGKDTQMPDYLVLISTLGGIALFGLNGFVIGPLIAALFIACWNLFEVAQDAMES